MEDYRQELLFVLSIIEAASIYKRNPKYVNDTIEMYEDAIGTLNRNETISRIKSFIKESLN